MLNFGGVTLFTPMFPPAIGAASFEGGSYVYESPMMTMMTMMMMMMMMTMMTTTTTTTTTLTTMTMTMTMTRECTRNDDDKE